jgi:peptidoglycan hydrolase CwlO-like protein
MKDKNELTESLKVLETELYDTSVDLHGISNKINSANAYQDELLQRLESNRNKITELNKEYFIKTGIISITSHRY